MRVRVAVRVRVRVRVRVDVRLITLSMTTPSDMRMPGAKYAPEVKPHGAIAETCAGRSLGSVLHSHSYSCCPAFSAIAM